VDYFKTADEEVRTYLSKQFALMLQRPNFPEELECALPSDEIERLDMLLETMHQMASYTLTTSS
jgi:hypothetical protein